MVMETDVTFDATKLDSPRPLLMDAQVIPLASFKVSPHGRNKLVLTNQFYYSDCYKDIFAITMNNVSS